MLRMLALSLCLALPLGCGDDEPSDEDLVDKFIEDVTGEVDAGYVPRVLGYVDMARFPLDVRVPRHAGVYGAQRAGEIERAFRQVIEQRFMGTKLVLRSDNVELEGARAEVVLGLMTAVGPLHVELTLQKAQPRAFKVSRVHITR